MNNTLNSLIEKFENKPPEIVFEWHDQETTAKGWAVINSLRNGAAGGGTRMRAGLDRDEVVALAKTMEVKFTVSGPPIGGAKSGIDFDPKDPRKQEVLKRWYKALFPLLKYYYGTGGDLNVDEIHEVIPITEKYGLWHPQEGIVNGHFDANQPRRIHMIGRLRQGVSKILEDQGYIPNSDKKYTVSDMITGYGVAQSVKHYYHLWGGNITQKTAIVQGWGNVGATAALYLASFGVKIKAVIDREGGVFSEEGMGLEEIKKLFYDRVGNQLVATNMVSFQEANKMVWEIPADIFVPAAASKLVSMEQLQSLLGNGVEVIACGANVPFKDNTIFFGPITEYADKNCALIPDFIANCGMARAFAHFMEGDENKQMTDKAIFTDVSQTILGALTKVNQQQPGNRNLARKAFEIALAQLV